MEVNEWVKHVEPMKVHRTNSTYIKISNESNVKE